jgi:hypothetical protein
MFFVTQLYLYYLKIHMLCAKFKAWYVTKVKYIFLLGPFPPKTTIKCNPHKQDIHTVAWMILYIYMCIIVLAYFYFLTLHMFQMILQTPNKYLDNFFYHMITYNHIENSRVYNDIMLMMRLSHGRLHVSLYFLWSNISYIFSHIIIKYNLYFNLNILRNNLFLKIIL